MPDPTLTQLREAEEEAWHNAMKASGEIAALALNGHVVSDPMCAAVDNLEAVLTRYRDAVAARVREEERVKLDKHCACGAVLRRAQRERTTCRKCQTERIREGVLMHHRLRHGGTPNG